MKNTRDIDCHELHKLQIYRLVAGREELVLSNTISHEKNKYNKYSSFVFFPAAESKVDASLVTPKLLGSRILG